MQWTKAKQQRANQDPLFDPEHEASNFRALTPDQGDRTRHWLLQLKAKAGLPQTDIYAIQYHTYPKIPSSVALEKLNGEIM